MVQPSSVLCSLDFELRNNGKLQLSLFKYKGKTGYCIKFDNIFIPPNILGSGEKKKKKKKKKTPIG